jgi:hypothetical protein
MTSLGISGQDTQSNIAGIIEHSLKEDNPRVWFLKDKSWWGKSSERENLGMERPRGEGQKLQEASDTGEWGKGKWQDGCKEKLRLGSWWNSYFPHFPRQISFKCCFWGPLNFLDNFLCLDKPFQSCHFLCYQTTEECQRKGKQRVQLVPGILG